MAAPITSSLAFGNTQPSPAHALRETHACPDEVRPAGRQPRLPLGGGLFPSPSGASNRPRARGSPQQHDPQMWPPVCSWHPPTCLHHPGNQQAQAPQPSTGIPCRLRSGPPCCYSAHPTPTLCSQKPQLEATHKALSDPKALLPNALSLLAEDTRSPPQPFFGTLAPRNRFVFSPLLSLRLPGWRPQALCRQPGPAGIKA